MKNPVREAWEREMQALKKAFGFVPPEAKEDGPMEWDEAMEKPLIIPIKLEQGGEIEIKINHENHDAQHKVEY